MQSIDKERTWVLVFSAVTATVDQADIVISFVMYDVGAAKTLAYAQRRKKHIINLATEGD